MINIQGNYNKSCSKLTSTEIIQNHQQSLLLTPHLQPVLLSVSLQEKLDHHREWVFGDSVRPDKLLTQLPQKSRLIGK